MEVVIAPDFLRNSAPKIEVHSTVNYVNLQDLFYQTSPSCIEGSSKSPGGFFCQRPSSLPFYHYAR